MSKNKMGKEQIWQLLFLVIPIAFVLPVANILEPKGGITSVLISGALGMFGAVIGMLLFKFGESKTNWFKGGLLAVFFSLMVFVLLGIKEFPSLFLLHVKYAVIMRSKKVERSVNIVYQIHGIS